MSETSKPVPVVSLIRTYDQCQHCPLIENISGALRVNPSEKRTLHLLTCQRRFKIIPTELRIVKGRSFVGVMAVNGRFDNINNPNLRIRGYGVEIFAPETCPIEG